MTCFIALLRAVNVGGTGKLPMADLKAICEAAGFHSVRTYIASGNVIFESKLHETAVRKELERRLLAYAGKPVSVLVRTAAEMAEVLARNPFPNAPGNRTLAIFLDEAPPSNALSSVSGLFDEEVGLGRKEIYVRYGPNMARSKLKIPAAKNGTARNMNTVAKLASMASGALFRLLLAFALTAALGCTPRRVADAVPQPRIIPHTQWESRPRLGYEADGVRRNKLFGDSLLFHDLNITVLGTGVDSNGPKPGDVVRLRLELGEVREERSAREGSAFNWRGFHVAVVAIYGPGELSAGLVALEVATLTSLPPHIASSDVAGGANMRLRIPHRITHVTLHHTGSAEPLRPHDDPAEKLRGLQSWGAAERNWWDVPYHFLLDLEGDIYEGRDWRYMGETNTTYDPAGHFLISVIGNYERQEPTAAQLAAIADLMAWALKKFDLPLDRIGGHYNYATTSCPGQHLRKHLEDGTLRGMVAARLK